MAILVDPASRPVLLNALFIFLFLLFSTAVAGVAVYRLRPLLSTSKASTGPESQHSSLFSPKNVTPVLTARELEKVDSSLGLRILAQTPGSQGRQRYESQNRSKFSPNFSTLGHVFGSEPSKLLSGSLPPRIDVIQKESSILFQRPRYSESEMRHLHTPLLKAPNESLGLTRLLRFENSFPTPQFDVMKIATDVILEVSLALTEQDPSSRALGLFQLAAIGGTRKIYDNPIYYHEQFCLLVEKQVESVEWYKSSVGGLQMMFVDLMVCFSWSHWHWHEFATLAENEQLPNCSTILDSPLERDDNVAFSKLIEYFDRGHAEPFIVSHVSIFRLLSRLSLAISQLNSECPPVAKMKLQTVFRICATNTKCFEHRQLLPLVSQSVVAAKNESTKLFFYDIASEIICPHLRCCIEMQDVFYPKSNLQGLVLQGLCVNQSLGVRTKAANLARLLGKIYPEVNIWSDSVKSNKSVTHMPDASKVPGSWMKYSI